MIQNTPDIINKANRFLCFGDLLCYKLTGQAITSHNLAARTMLFDVNKLCWSDEILKSINIDKSILPNPMPSGKPAGHLFPDIAAELGISEDVIVTVGGHDQSCGALGVGITGAGKAAYSIGTVECITPAFSSCVLNDTMRQSNLATYPFVIDGLYTTVAFNITGGNLLRWYRDNFAQLEIQQAKKINKDVYDIILSEIPDEPTNIFLQPHFTSTGTPYFDPNPTGAFIGLDLNTSKAQMVKALLEGVTYEMRLNLELLKKSGIEINELFAFGGGTKSEKWLQIKADVLGIPIHSIATSEAGCLGAALLAAQASGDIESVTDAAQNNSRPLKTYEPNSENMKLYDQRYEIYSEIYQTIKPLGNKINKLTN
jgi:xylulokinase